MRRSYHWVIRYMAATICALFLLVTPAQAGITTPMLDAVDAYAHSYASYQGWLYESQTGQHGDYRRGYLRLRYLANPAPGAEHCFDDVVYVESCPAKWWVDDFPVYMKVQVRVARCGPGWFVVSTPLDRRRCQWRTLPAWSH